MRRISGAVTIALVSPKRSATKRIAQAPALPSMAELEDIRRTCRRFLGGHGHRSTAEQLAAIPQDVQADSYGDGGVVAELEAKIATLLGKPTAVFVPSGTMGQQIVLRVHADRRNRRTVLYHPQCHLAVHELGAAQRLHGLQGRAVGDRNRLISIDDLRIAPDGRTPIAEAPAALLLELPQRDIGGQLPPWKDLVAQVDWAHSVGAAAHMDGARLWQCAGFYERSLDAIAAPFDTVYVSFYKDVGALAGAAVAGPADVIAEVREWRQRHGGTLYSMWPHAASALANLRARLPRMPSYQAHALALADALRNLPGLQLVPDPPQSSMFHLVLHRDAEALQAAALRLAKDERIWTWGAFYATEVPGISRTELSVGDATLLWTPAEFRGVIASLLAG
ncbi:MAG: beta-eliminating lyase-related protein [Candidatus Limnocylindrales bacterium]